MPNFSLWLMKHRIGLYTFVLIVTLAEVIALPDNRDNLRLIASFMAGFMAGSLLWSPLVMRYSILCNDVLVQNDELLHDMGKLVEQLEKK